MDHLARDALEAEKAGLSYGKWKALHPHTSYTDFPSENRQGAGRNYKICKQCGKEFYTTNHSRKYCSDECRAASIAKRELKKYHKTKQKPKEKACEYCGAMFTPNQNDKRIKYCSKECCSKASNLKKRSRKNISILLTTNF